MCPLVLHAAKAALGRHSPVLPVRQVLDFRRPPRGHIQLSVPCFASCYSGRKRGRRWSKCAAWIPLTSIKLLWTALCCGLTNVFKTISTWGVCFFVLAAVRDTTLDVPEMRHSQLAKVTAAPLWHPVVRESDVQRNGAVLSETDVYSAAPVESLVQQCGDGKDGNCVTGVTRSYFRASESSRPRKDLKISDIITYRFHTAISGGTPEKIIFILCAVTPFLVFCSALYKRVATKDSWFACVYKTYCTLLRTPSSVSREKELAPALVLNGVFLCGLWVYGVMLGLITSDIKEQVHMIKEGMTPVACRDHTVICNWNESTPALLRQISKAQRGRRTFRGPVVVLANRSKGSMDQVVEQEVFTKTSHRFDVETRRGDPMDVADLLRTRVSAARNVFIMHPDANTTVSPPGQIIPDLATLTQKNALKVATALRVASLRETRPDHPMVLQDSTGGWKEIGYCDKFLGGYKAGGEALGPALLPLGENVMTSLTAQCACRPGLVRVVDYLFTHSPEREQLRYMGIPSGTTHEYGVLRRSLRGGVALGFWSAADGRTILNPDDKDTLEPGDQVLVLSKYSKLTFESTPAIPDSVISDAQDWMASQHKVNAVEKPQRVIVLNWMQDIEPLLADFAEFSPAGSEIIFVQEQRHRHLPYRVGSVRFRQVVSKSHMDRDALHKAGWNNCNAIVYGLNGALADSVYDSQLLADIMVLQTYYNEAGCSKRLHILAPARDPYTASVVSHILKDWGDAKVRLTKVSPEARLILSDAQHRSIGDSTDSQASRFVAEPQRLYYNSSSNGLDTVSRHLVTSPKRHPGTRPPMDEVLPLQHIISAELFMPREFATAMLVHVAQEPKLMYILQEFFDSQSGHTIWLRSAQAYHIDYSYDPDPVSFAWISEAARTRGETALGVMTREGEVCLSPPAEATFKFRSGDRIVVVQTNRSLHS